MRQAATYVRMSREHQNYSPEHQRRKLDDYAAQRGFEIVREYFDSGISGLRFETRPGLKQLLADVVDGSAPFSTVLVYDVSRWGRFQDLDQSAHYEFICRQAGVDIAYCAEPFENDGSLVSSIVKHLKRGMAAEYSRDLSGKIARAQRGLAERGYWQGGPPGFGLRRMMLDRHGAALGVLEAGQHKLLQGSRSVLVLGPKDEVELVAYIYRLFVVGGMSRTALARHLNAAGHSAEGGARWTLARVSQVLRNEKYVSVGVHGKTWTRLGLRGRNAGDSYLRVDLGYPPLVSPKLFLQAQRALMRHKRRVSDAELLDELRGALARAGRLNRYVIRDDEQTHCPQVYARRFGGLETAYRLIGYEPSRRQGARINGARAARSHCGRWRLTVPSDAVMLDQLKGLLQREGSLSVDLINASPSLSAESFRRRFGGMRRVYALVGYRPTKAQERAMARSGGQTITAEEAADIRCVVSAGEAIA